MFVGKWFKYLVLLTETVEKVSLPSSVTLTPSLLLIHHELRMLSYHPWHYHYLHRKLKWYLVPMQIPRRPTGHIATSAALPRHLQQEHRMLVGLYRHRSAWRGIPDRLHSCRLRLYKRLASLWSWTRLNFTGMPAVKTGMGWHLLPASSGYSLSNSHPRLSTGGYVAGSWVSAICETGKRDFKKCAGLDR